MRKVFNKLVRDLIPQKIEADGRIPVIKKLEDQEAIVCLENKLLEEVNEYLQDKTIEELADIIEVIYAICKIRGFSIEELEQVRVSKEIKNGAFNEKYFLEYTEE